MKKLITIAAGLLITGSAFANTITLQRDTNIETAGYATKTEALNAGFNIADNLSALNKNQLRKALPVFSTNLTRNLEINNTEVQTQEVALNRNETQYFATVKVNYSFDAQDND